MLLGPTPSAALGGLLGGDNHSITERSKYVHNEHKLLVRRTVGSPEKGNAAGAGSRAQVL